MDLPSTTSEKGVLHPQAAASHFRLSRHRPSADLAGFVERCWIIRWDLRGRSPFKQEVLSHPAVNVAFERTGSGVYGVTTKKAAQVLEGKHQVFGIKFRPGAFYPFLKRPVSELTDRSLPIADVFGPEILDVERAVLATENDAEQIALVETFLRGRIPCPDPNVTQVMEIIAGLLQDSSLTRVEDVAKRHGLSVRSLQRLFHRYVGVSPKWVIQRYRLQEAAERLADAPGRGWAEIAFDLGYFDQAHFIKDFKAVVGVGPTEYAAMCQGLMRDAG